MPHRFAVTAKRLLLVALAVVLLALTAAPAHAAFPGDNGKIAYARGGAAIYTVNPDGTGTTYITNNPIPHDAHEPAWSPDGRKIAFRSRDEIYVMNADGTDWTNLTNNPAHDSDPSWSPDATRIVFRTIRDNTFELYVMNADGSGQRPISDSPIFGDEPVWSPDGTKIAFRGWVPASPGRSQLDILTVNPDGTGLTNLTHDAPLDGGPDWSPDGARIVFHSALDNQFTDLYTMNADGSGRVRLTHTGGVDQETEPAWSPDGTKIAYVTNTTEGAADDIQVMTAEGAFQTRLTFGGSHHAEPDWQPIPGYARPAGAVNFRVPLTIAYRECTSGNRAHSGGLGAASCNPAVQSSDSVSVGTPDANGAGAKSVGFLSLRVVPHTCCPPQDVLVSTSISDVRCKPATDAAVCGNLNTTGGPDYSGELEGNATIRITDRHNGPVDGTGGTDPATVRDLPFPMTYFCTNTPDASIGSSCTVNTSALAMYPGSSPAPRSNVEISQIEVFDGGPDGDVDTAGNTVFARQGIFIP